MRCSEEEEVSQGSRLRRVRLRMLRLGLCLEAGSRWPVASAQVRHRARPARAYSDSSSSSRGANCSRREQLVCPELLLLLLLGARSAAVLVLTADGRGAFSGFDADAVHRSRRQRVCAVFQVANLDRSTSIVDERVAALRLLVVLVVSATSELLVDADAVHHVAPAWRSRVRQRAAEGVCGESSATRGGTRAWRQRTGQLVTREPSRTRCVAAERWQRVRRRRSRYRSERRRARGLRAAGRRRGLLEQVDELEHTERRPPRRTRERCRCSRSESVRVEAALEWPGVLLGAHRRSRRHLRGVLLWRTAGDGVLSWLRTRAPRGYRLDCRMRSDRHNWCASFCVWRVHRAGGGRSNLVASPRHVLQQLRDQKQCTRIYINKSSNKY